MHCTSIFLFTLSSVITTLAAPTVGGDATVIIYGSNDCSPVANAQIVASPYRPEVSCFSTMSNSAKVTGQGCATYYYSDANCTSNLFGEGNAVPDSSCYAGVKGVSICCN